MVNLFAQILAKSLPFEQWYLKRVPEAQKELDLCRQEWRSALDEE
jgi:hypothetical protein